MKLLLAELKLGARDVLSKRSRPYLARKDEIDAFAEDELIRAMVDEPRLVRRPIVTSETVSVVGAKQADLERFMGEIRD